MTSETIVHLEAGEQLILFNDKLLPANQSCIKCNDRAFTLGHGLFETLFIHNNQIPALSYHWQRLVTGSALLGCPIPFTLEKFQKMILQLTAANKLEKGMAGARLTLSRGESERGLLATIDTLPNFSLSVFKLAASTKSSFAVKIVNLRKNEFSPTAQVKSTSYIDNILAKEQAVREGFDEAILLNTAANVADGSVANIFMVKNKQIFTPKLSDGALPGVVRQILLTELNHKYNITEKTISLSCLMNADEIFLTNALMGVKPVHRINNKNLSNFNLSGKLANLLREAKNYI